MKKKAFIRRKHSKLRARYSKTNPIPFDEAEVSQSQTYIWECEKKHLISATVASYIRNEFKFCPDCNKTRSKKEKEIFDLISQYISKDKIRLNYCVRDEESKKRYFADIYITDRKIAIEYNSIFWHKTTEGVKDSEYHIKKRQHFEKQGIRLINIWEDQWKARRTQQEAALLKEIGAKTYKVKDWSKVTLTAKPSDEVDREYDKFVMRHIPQTTFGIEIKEKNKVLGYVKCYSKDNFKLLNMAPISSEYKIPGINEHVIKTLLKDKPESHLCMVLDLDFYDYKEYEKAGWRLKTIKVVDGINDETKTPTITHAKTGELVTETSSLQIQDYASGEYSFDYSNTTQIHYHNTGFAILVV